MSSDLPENINVGATTLIIDLKQIADADKTQIRESENGYVLDALVAQYQMEAAAQGIQNDAYPEHFSPIVVVRKPKEPDKYWILDGHHRYKAALMARHTKIVASVIDNSVFNVQTLDDLHFLQGRENISVTANRTPETKRRQVMAVLKKRPYWTMNQIAQFCRVSFYLVEEVIKAMEGSAVKTRKPSQSAKEAVDKPENKKKSNRKLAKELGVSEGTVRNVRKNSNSKNYAPATTDETCCAFCGKADAPYVVALPDGKELSFCDEACACQYSCREGLYFESDDKRFYNNDAEARDAHALDNVSKKARQFMDDHAPAENVTSSESAKQPYEKPEVLDAPPASADDKPKTTLLTPQEIVTIDNDGTESHCVGYALPMFLQTDDVVQIVVAALSYKYNSVMDVANKLIQVAKQQCSVNGNQNSPSKR